MQVNLTKISYIRTLFKVWIIQNFGLFTFRVRIRQGTLYWRKKLEMLIVLGRASSYRCWFRTRKFCHKKYIMACIMKYFIQENSCEKKAHMEIFKTLKVCLQFAVTNNTFSCIQKWLKNLGNICLETRLRY